jgi:hypothetical protein
MEQNLSVARAFVQIEAKIANTQTLKAEREHSYWKKTLHDSSPVYMNSNTPMKYHQL